MNFRESFRGAYLLAKERVVLAREMDTENPDLGDHRFLFYLRRDQNFFSNPRISFSECMGLVLGYALGTYTTFCPTQKRLNRFDRVVSELKEKKIWGIESC